MGVCISIHHKASETKVQNMSFESTNKPNHMVIIHPSSSNDQLSVMDGHVAVKRQLPPPSQPPATFSQYGSKEETFFDSQAWLDSDCDDDFMSVNGEFTPSRGNTPVHHSLTLGTSRVNGGATSKDNNEPNGSTPQPSPTPEKKKRLLDLFKESLRDNHDSNLENAESLHKDGEMDLNKDGEMDSNKVGLKPKSVSHVGSRHGCFSNLLYVHSIGRQQKKSPTPKAVVG